MKLIHPLERVGRGGSFTGDVEVRGMLVTSAAIKFQNTHNLKRLLIDLKIITQIESDFDYNAINTMALFEE